MQYYSYEWLDPVMQMGLKQLCVNVNQWKDRLVKTKKKIVILRIKAKIERNYLELYSVWGKDCFFLGATCKRPNGAVQFWWSALTRQSHLTTCIYRHRQRHGKVTEYMIMWRILFLQMVHFNGTDMRGHFHIDIYTGHLIGFLSLEFRTSFQFTPLNYLSLEREEVEVVHEHSNFRRAEESFYKQKSS